MIQKSKLYAVSCNNLADKYVVARSFQEVENIIQEFFEYTAVIKDIKYIGDCIHENNRTED